MARTEQGVGSALYGWEALWKMLGGKASGISNPSGTVDTDKGTSVDVGGIRLPQGGEADWGGGVFSNGQGSREGQSYTD